MDELTLPPALCSFLCVHLSILTLLLLLFLLLRFSGAVVAAARTLLTLPATRNNTSINDTSSTKTSIPLTITKHMPQSVPSKDDSVEL